MDGDEPMTARVKDSLRLTATLERLWADDRFDATQRQTRIFINAWLVTRYSMPDHGQAFKETLRRTGEDRQSGWWSLVRGDAPKFDGYTPASVRGCCVPKTRGPNAGRPCGRTGTSFRVTNPENGEWEIRTYCTKLHRAEGDAMRVRERALTNVPEPMPNRGGLMPCYIRASNWPDLYAWADSGWQPPYVGIVADDWPVMAKVATPPVVAAKLTSVDGGGETAPSTATPVLRLVTP